MVAPHPDLHRKFRNTKKLVKEGREHLLPGLVKQFPHQYLMLENFNIIDAIKPWVEISKPRKRNLLKSGLETLAPVRDRIIVLYVDFPDQYAQVSPGAIYNRFFSPSDKSLRNFYAENSYGKYIPEGEIHGPYHLPQTLAYYANNQSGLGAYPNNTQKLVEDAINLAAADPAINWASFDNSGDHVIDYLIIVHAGAEAAYTGKTTDIWAHVSEISPVIRNGFGFRYYAAVSEFMSSPADMQRTGIDSHEFGHLGQGLPDLYDYSGNSNGAGMFSIMAHGSWVDNGFTPTHLDAWSKYFCGFSSILVNQPGMLLSQDAETHDVNYLFTTQNLNEYFMIENRQKNYFDTFLPADGILIWKVNVSQQYNNNELCYKVGLVQADGMKHLENSVNYGDPGDSYPGSTINRTVGMATTPSTMLCGGQFPGFSIRSITDSASVMSFVAELCTAPIAKIQI